MLFAARKHLFIPPPIELKDPGSDLVTGVGLGDLDTFVEACGQRRIPDDVRHRVLSVQFQYRHASPHNFAVDGQIVSVWLTLSAEAAMSSQNVRSWRGSGGVAPIINEHREAAMFDNFRSFRKDNVATREHCEFF